MRLGAPATLWKYTAGEMRRRPGRTLLMLAGIALGVAAVVAVLLTTAATRRAYRDMFAAVTGRAGLEVVAEGLGGFEEREAGLGRGVPGVKAVVPVVQAPAGLWSGRGAVLALVLGVDPERDGAARDYHLSQGASLAERGDGVLLEAGFARRHGFALGQTVTLVAAPEGTGSATAAFPVVGLLEGRGAATFNGGAVVFMRLEKARALFGLKDGQINSLQVVLEDGASLPRAEEELRRRLPAGLTVQTPASRGELAQDTLLSTEQGLTSLSAVSLVAGAFVILNAFQMNLGERRRQLAILRALGATRGQVLRVLLREAALLGAVGTVLGVALGLGLAVGCLRMIERLMGVRLPPLLLTVEPFVLAGLLGPGVALGATLVPAARAARRAPLRELFPHRTDREEGPRLWPGYVGLAPLGLPALLVFGILRGWFSAGMSPLLLAAACGLCLAGCVLVLPLVLGPLAALARRLLLPFLGTEGKLAFRQLARHRGRTALTAGVLVIAVVISVGIGNSMLNNIRHSHEWYERILDADFVVRGAMPEIGGLSAVPLADERAEEIAALPGVDHVDRASFVWARVQDPRRGGKAERQVVLIARQYTYSPGKPLPFLLDRGDPDLIWQGLRDRRDEVVVGTALAQRLGLDVGGELVLNTGHGPRPFRVAGTASEYTVGGMALYLDWDVARRHYGDFKPHALLVSAAEDKAPEVGERLRALTEKHHLLLQSCDEFQDLIDRMVAGVVGLIWSLLTLVFVVASLGVVNTLTRNVLEQTRELGVLRAIGMKRGQLRKIVLGQALALAVISLVPGVLVGVAMSYLMTVTTYQLQGQAVAFRLHPWLMAACVAAALVLTVLAAWFPARRAARLQVIRAIQYE